MSKAAIIGVGLGIIGIIAVVTLVELFAGPVPINKMPMGGGIGPTGKVGYQIVKEAGEATNVATNLTGDIGQIAGDVGATVQNVNSIIGSLGNLGNTGNS